MFLYLNKEGNESTHTYGLLLVQFILSKRQQIEIKTGILNIEKP